MVARAGGASGDGEAAMVSARDKALADEEARKLMGDIGQPVQKVAQVTSKAKSAKAIKREAEEEKQRQKAADNLKAKKKGAEKYLKTWKTNKAAWKFSSVTQSWLLKHMLDRKMISKKAFGEYMVEYILSIKGGARTAALNRAQKAVDEIEADDQTLEDRVAEIEANGVGADAPKNEDGETPSVESMIKAVRSKYKRAQQIVQALSETDKPKNESDSSSS